MRRLIDMKRKLIGKHLNLWDVDVKFIEDNFGKEHGLFSKITRGVINNFVEKIKLDIKKKEGKGD